MDPKIVLSWEAMIKGAGLNITTISTELKSRGYLSLLFGRARNDPGNMPKPSGEFILALADRLGRPVGDLMGRSAQIRAHPYPGYDQEVHKQTSRVFSDVLNLLHGMAAARGFRPTVEDVVGWWRSTNGRLAECGQIEESFDLVEVPSNDARTVHPHRVGGMSLAAETLGAASVDRLANLVQSMTAESQLDLVASYRSASACKNPVFSEPMSVAIDLPDHDTPLDVEYISLKLPVAAPDGTPFIVSYCFPI